ncbi:MAG: T9SS type A sorting domain-containing protein [Bacteroidia bacterium]|nr:T9SS type A sorting domain-containing protein [Bacteroidia bacterium]
MKKIILITYILNAALYSSYAQPSSLDSTFGINGKVVSSIGMEAAAYSIAIQSDGKIVVAGGCQSMIGLDSFNGSFALIRYNSNGSLDNTFGSNGKVTTDFGIGGEGGNSVAIQSDGKIVVAGVTETNIGSYIYRFALVRYNSNGSLDNTFGSSGKIITMIGSSDLGYSVAIQSDGKIVMAGESYSGVNHDFALVRYNSDGSLDQTFGSAGKITTAIGNGEAGGGSVAIQSDGKIIVAGGDGNFALIRYNNNGTIDNTFGSGGKVTTTIGNAYNGRSIAIRNDGKILVAGSGEIGSKRVFGVACYNTDGSLDSTFSSNGKVSTDVGIDYNFATSVATQNDGKIVVTGLTTYENPYDTDFALVRYNSDGSLDSSLDSDGIVITDFEGADCGNSVAIQSDGKIVVAGESTSRYSSYIAVARYINTCTPPQAPTGASATICINSTASLSAAGTGTLGWYNQAIGGTYLGGGANYTTPILNTTTTYYLQDSTCAASVTRKEVIVTVNPLLVVIANASDTNVCEGTSVILTGGGATSYTWSDAVIDGQGFVPTTTTTYTVTGTDKNNCSNTATKTINVNPLPTVTANANATNVCVGNPVTLTGGGASSYTWSGGVINGVGFVPSATTTYTVTGTDGNNCSNTSTKTIHVNPLPTVNANASGTIVCAGTSITLSGDGATSYTWSGGVTNGLSFVPSTSGTYTVTGTDDNNCSNTATKTINVNPLPAVTATASATNVCEGTIVTLTGGGAASYIWSDGIANGMPFITSTTTTYTVRGTDGNNCSNTATKTINVTPLLDLTTSLSGLTISANQNGAIYQWLNCNNGNSVIAGATSQSYTASINGNYAVIVKMNGCTDTSTCVNLNITGMEKTLENNIQLKVFPNPGNGSITITLSGVEGQSIDEMIYTIKNESGQTIQTFKLNTSNNYTINIENLSNGIYFIVGLNGNQMINQKVVIAK